jgi:hypothetical protein
MDNLIKLLHKDKLESVYQQQIEKQKKHVGQIQIHKGHKLYEINIITNQIQELTFDSKDVMFNGKSLVKNKRLTMKKDCIYISALNKKNVLKKLYKK